MAWPAVLVIVPVGIIFILSGLIVNLIQAVLFILVRPVSKSLHRRINKIVAELLWLELIVLVDWWAKLKIEVYADDETFELLGVTLRFLFFFPFHSIILTFNPCSELFFI
ncbi:hypothetical protein NC651_002647 [Populus alba x Populus x berolinensis]|nr:hypothetical protein NC651_002647 [Populus alba x Populus x berolinensis]